jgi:rhamnosyl/mannosyltransferase
MRQAWETLARQLGLSERVKFVGDVENVDLPAWYQRAGIFVLPATARSEAFGTVLLEAMACGLPCISTELGTGTSWIVQDGVTGVVVPPCDVAALAGALAGLLDNPARRRAMGQAGRQRVEHGFSQEDMVRGVESVYAEVLRKG